MSLKYMKKLMKRQYSFLFIILILVFINSGCNGTSDSKNSQEDTQSESVIKDDSSENNEDDVESDTENTQDSTSLPVILGKYDLSLERYTYEHIYTTKAQSGVPGEELLGLGNTMTAYGDSYYVLLIEHETARPKILKINQKDTGIIESGYLEGSDYTPRADGHHHFTMEVDRDGFLHIVGDMHNYVDSKGNIERTQDHLPERLQGQHILYWRMTRSGDVSSFDFYGDKAEKSPQGIGFTYPKLFKDRDGAVYMTARFNIGRGQDSTINLNGRGAGLTRYEPDSGMWTEFGDLPAAEENPYALAPVLAYETEAEADSHFYTKIIPEVAFDNANRMHFAATLNNNGTDIFRDIAADLGMPGMYHWNTDLVYLRSDDLLNFNRADDTLVELPAGVDTGDDQADVVFTRNDPSGEAVLGIESHVTTNRFGNPVICFEQKRLYDVPNWGNDMTFAEWDGDKWNIHNALGSDGSLDRGLQELMTDPSGVITFIPKGTGRFWRMWELDGELHQVSGIEGMDHSLGSVSQSFFQDTGDILGRSFDKETETLTFYRIRVSK